MAEQEFWSAQKLLEAWGLRVCGGSLKNPLKTSTGGYAGLDDEWQAMRFVESIEGFQDALPVLRWVYRDGQPVETYQFRGPGQTLMYALLRNNWGKHIGTNAKEVPGCVLRDFLSTLESVLRARPFVPVREPRPETVEMIVATAGRRLAS